MYSVYVELAGVLSGNKKTVGSSGMANIRVYDRDNDEETTAKWWAVI